MLEFEGLKVFDIGEDPGGVLSYAELSYPAQRIYWLRGPSGVRGGHAHRKLRQIMVCLSGKVTIDFSDATLTSSVCLEANQGIEVEPGLWREISPLAVGDLLLVCASFPFDEKDYIRSFPDFVRWKNA